MFTRCYSKCFCDKSTWIAWPSRWLLRSTSLAMTTDSLTAVSAAMYCCEIHKWNDLCNALRLRPTQSKSIRDNYVLVHDDCLHRVTVYPQYPDARAVRSQLHNEANRLTMCWTCNAMTLSQQCAGSNCDSKRVTHRIRRQMYTSLIDTGSCFI